MDSNPNSETATAICSELLLLHQSVVVHDLRGDLNGLLLTLDFLRRQLMSRPETAGILGENLGDLDQMRASLTRTLNQLEEVGHARRVVGGRESPSPADLNLRDVTTEVLRTLGDRIRRRSVALTLPQPGNIVVRAEPVLLHLVLHRMFSALIELGRNADLRVDVSRPRENLAQVKGALRGGSIPAPDLMEHASKLRGTVGPVPPVVLALGLCIRLAERIGGAVRQMAASGDETFVLVLDIPTERRPE